jgi:hypothetical protein
VALPEVTSSVFTKTPPDAKIFRSSAVRFAGWAWMVVAAANLVDLAWRGRDLASLVATTALLLGCGIAYVVALRPKIVAHEGAVQFHNLLRDVTLPWDAIERFEGGDAVYAHTEHRRHRAYVLQTSPRARAKAEFKARREEKKVPDAVAEYMRNRTATDFTVETMKEMAEKHQAEGPATVTWSWPAIAALGIPTLLFAVALIVTLA